MRKARAKTSKGPTGYSFDDHTQLWMRDGALPVDYADGSEEALVQLFESLEDVSPYPTDLASHITDWPTRYHLSHQRVNLLMALEELIAGRRRALELGAGLGALTRWLADVVGEVDAVEGSPARARAARLRTKSRPNVRVLVDDITRLALRGRYDLVTLVGVLEYVPLTMSDAPGGTMAARRHACVEFLKRIKARMDKDALLVIAVENRLGLKYWAGCTEDHTGRHFDGLIGYPDATPVTFSRGELEDILARAGFEGRRFYHAFPDYKLPEVLLRESDEMLDLAPHNWLHGFAEDRAGERLYLWPDPLVLEGLDGTGLLWELSDSFVAVASPSSTARLDTGWLARKYSNAAVPELHHVISLEPDPRGGYRITRAPIGHGLPSADLPGVRFGLSGGRFVEGPLMVFEAYRALRSREWRERLTSLNRELHDTCLSQGSHAGTDAGGYPLLAGMAPDLAYWNLVRTPSGGLELIDRKWEAIDPIPLDLVLFRNLYWLGTRFRHFLPVDSVQRFVLECMRRIFPGIDAARITRHLQAESRFQSLVFKGRDSGDTLAFDAQPTRESVTLRLQDASLRLEEMSRRLAQEREALCEQVARAEQNAQTARTEASHLGKELSQLSDTRAAEREAADTEIRRLAEELDRAHERAMTEIEKLRHILEWRSVRGLARKLARGLGIRRG